MKKERRSHLSAIATPPAAPQRPRSSRPLFALVSSPTDPVPGVNPHHRGGTVLFEVAFTSATSDADLALLGHVLDLWTHMRPDPTSPGVARLDHFSGLFLERGAEKDQWVLQARTWGKPAAQTVHEWHLLAAQAARQLDPHVALPERPPSRRPSTQVRPLGQAADKRLTRIHQRLAGLP